LRDDIEILQLEAECKNLLAECCDVVSVSSADLFDEAVEPKAFAQLGDLTAGFFFQPAAQVFVLETADVELATAQCAEEFFVIGVEEVEASILSVVLLDRLGDLVQLVCSGR
jgi:hypothetical protein